MGASTRAGNGWYPLSADDALAEASGAGSVGAAQPTRAARQAAATVAIFMPESVRPRARQHHANVLRGP